MKQKHLIRLVIIQDYCLLRKALAERIDREPGIKVCGHTSDTTKAIQLISCHDPDVVLMNVSLRSPGGFVQLKQMRKKFKGLSILAFSCDPEFEHLHADLAISCGAAGFVSSADNEEKLIRAVRLAAVGETYISKHLSGCRAKERSPKTLYSNLSRREIEVFCLTGFGHVPKGIAEKLNLSVKTIESYRERIREKMGLRDGAELLYAASSFMRRAALKDPDAPLGEALLEATLQRAG